MRNQPIHFRQLQTGLSNNLTRRTVKHRDCLFEDCLTIHTQKRITCHRAVSNVTSSRQNAHLTTICM